MSTESVAATQTFVESFAAKLDAQIATAASQDPTPEPAAPPAAAAAEDPTPARAGSDSALATPESDAEATHDPKDQKDPTLADDPASPESETEEEGEPPAPVTPPEFAAVLARLGIEAPADMPAEHLAKLTDFAKRVEAGITRARQKDTAALVALKAEARVQAERPADFIAAALRKDATLIERVNALLDNDSPTAVEAHDVVMERAREKALQAEQATAPDVAAEAEEEAALDAHLAARLAEHKITAGPGLALLLENAALVTHAQTGAVRLTRTQLDAIVTAYAADITAARAHARRLEERRQSARTVQDKLADRRTAGLAVKPGAGSPPAPAAAPAPKTPEEFSTYFARKLDAQRRSA